MKLQEAMLRTTVFNQGERLARTENAQRATPETDTHELRMTVARQASRLAASRKKTSRTTHAVLAAVDRVIAADRQQPYFARATAPVPVVVHGADGAKSAFAFMMNKFGPDFGRMPRSAQ